MGIKDIVKAKSKTDNKAAASKTDGVSVTAGKAGASGTDKTDKKNTASKPAKKDKKTESAKPAKAPFNFFKKEKPVAASKAAKAVKTTSAVTPTAVKTGSVTPPSPARTGLNATSPQKTVNPASATSQIKPAGVNTVATHPADNNISIHPTANGVKTTTMSAPAGKTDKKKEPSVLPWIIASVILGVIILILLILIIVRKFGPRSIKFVEYTGMIDVERDDDYVDTEPEMKLKSGDLITVNSGSTLSLLIDSDKHLEFDPDSSFYVYATGTKGNGKTHIDLIEGSSLIILDKKLGGGSTFEVTTPNATLNVTGTTFTVSYSSYTDATNVSVTEGNVSVSYGEGQSADLMAGNGCSIEGEEFTERNKPYFTVTRLYPEYKDTPPDPDFLRFAYTLKGREKPSTFNLASGAASDGENALATEAFNLNQSYMGANEDEISSYMDSYRLSKLNQPAPETPDGDTMSGWYLDTFSYGNPDERDITGWFPEEINLQLDTGSKKFHVTRVVMWPQVFDEYLSNGVVQDAYVKELGFGFYGYME